MFLTQKHSLCGDKLDPQVLCSCLGDTFALGVTAIEKDMLLEREIVHLMKSMTWVDEMICDQLVELVTNSRIRERLLFEHWIKLLQ